MPQRPICKTDAGIEHAPGGGDWDSVECSICLPYDIARSALPKLDDPALKSKGFLVSHALRDLHTSASDRPMITTDHVLSFINDLGAPHLVDQLDNVVRHLGDVLKGKNESALHRISRAELAAIAGASDFGAFTTSWKS
jgi:hypothetical protein